VTVFGEELEKGSQTSLKPSDLAESYGGEIGDEDCPYRIKLDTGWGGTFVTCPVKFNEMCSSQADQCATYHQLVRENV